MMLTTYGIEQLACPTCDVLTPCTDFADCSVCGESACTVECLIRCDCGCLLRAHRACMVAWEHDWKTGTWRYWRRECLLDHSAKCEIEATEYLAEAARARQAARRNA